MECVFFIQITCARLRPGCVSNGVSWRLGSDAYCRFFSFQPKNFFFVNEFGWTLVNASQTLIKRTYRLNIKFLEIDHFALNKQPIRKGNQIFDRGKKGKFPDI